MTAGAHESGGGFGKSAGVNAARGIAVMVFAVLIGLLLMAKGLGESDSALAAGGTTTTSTAASSSDGDESTGDVGTDADADSGTDDGTTIPEEAVTTVPDALRTPAEVRVLVLNGSGGIKGVAGRGTDLLEEAGYDTAVPDDAKSPGPSVILYTEGYELDAQAVALVFGIPVESTVAVFDPATSPVEELQGANIIVRVGNDNVIQI